MLPACGKHTDLLLYSGRGVQRRGSAEEGGELLQRVWYGEQPQLGYGRLRPVKAAFSSVLLKTHDPPSPRLLSPAPHGVIPLIERTICKRCILDASVAGIQFSENGVCNHCRLFDRLQARYPGGETAKKRLEYLLSQVKSQGRTNKYDCIVGISGGLDSSYCVYIARKLGLRPLAVHFDNGWVTEVAKENIDKVVSALGLDLEVVRPNWSELRNYYRACLKASVPDICLPCMVGIASSLYQAAAAQNIRYIFLGTSFRTEGLTPARWSYVDGMYFENLIEQFGSTASPRREFNRICLSHLFYYMVVKRIKTVQLPLYMAYRGEDIRATLERELGWKYGGRHHFDCAFKPFLSYIHEAKFGIDLRKIPLSALVRSGEMTREQALAGLREVSSRDGEAAVEYCRARLGVTVGELEAILRNRPKNFLDYRNYYSILRIFAPFTKLLGKLHVVPETLYERYFELV